MFGVFVGAVLAFAADSRRERGELLLPLIALGATCGRGIGPS